MSLLLDKTGHFVKILRNREDGIQINPYDFLLYSRVLYCGSCTQLFDIIGGYGSR
jgi:hypothetical protein